MYIRESWGYSHQCRVGTKLCVAHECIRNLDAPIHNGNIRSHRWSQLIIHLSGDVTYSTAQDRYGANTLDIFSTGLNENYGIEWGRTQPYERIVVYFDDDLFDRIFPDKEDKDVLLRFLDHKKYKPMLKLNDQYKDELIELINLIDAVLGVNSGSSAVVSAFTNVMRLFEFVGRVVSSGESESKTVVRKKNDIVTQITEFVSENFREVSSIAEIAEHLHVSPEYLSRRFKAEMNMTLKSYILDKKLHYANHLINLGYNVTEAAYNSGFSGTSYFIQLYKKKFNITPGKK